MSDAPIKDRYELVRTLGSGGFGSTWLALDHHTGREVALKELDVRRADDWKSIELFEREASTLEELDHRRIPSYVDAFELEDDDGANSRFFLVQELAPGRSLDELARDGGWRPDRDGVITMARDLLEVCAYLHALNPPVIHRDIKPGNVMRSESGEVSLVDFGSVKAGWKDRSGGSTVVGTLGYMAPEQLRGAADGRSDLFGLGSTIVFVLTRQDPEDLPTKGLKTDTHAILPHDPALARWLDRMISPDPDGRFESANHALEALARIDSTQTQDEPEPTDDPEDSGDAPKPEPATRPMPGSLGHTESLERESRTMALACAILMVLTGLSTTVFPIGWAASLVGPVAMFLFWVFCYTGLTPKTPAPSPESKRVEASGSLVASGIASVFTAVAVGAYWPIGTSSAPAIVGLMLWCIVLFFAWVLVSSEYDAWRKWSHRAAFEDHMGAWLPASSSDKDPLQMKRTPGGVRVGKAAGLMPWTLASFGLLGLIASGTAAWLGAIPGVGILGSGTFIALGILVAISRKVRTSHRLDIEGDTMTLRYRGKTRSIATSEVTGWTIHVRCSVDLASDANADTVAGSTHEVTVEFATRDGRDERLMYVEEADDLETARQKRAMLDALLRKDLSHIEPPRVEHSTGAVVFDWDEAWTEEERFEREVATSSVW